MTFKAKAYHCALELKLFCYCAKWKKSLKRGLLVEQYLVVKVAAQRFMLFGFSMHNGVKLFLQDASAFSRDIYEIFITQYDKGK